MENEDRHAMDILYGALKTTIPLLPIYQEFRKKKLISRLTLQQEKIKLSRTCLFSRLECLFQTAEPAHKRTKTIFSAQCEI